MSDNPYFLQLADYFFLVFHSSLILFNLFGWIWAPLRKWHLSIITLTFFSWTFLGIWYGWGYCPLTDWHWNILYKLGIEDLPDSYVSYLLQRLLGLRLPDQWVDMLTLFFALVAWIISIKVNFFRSR